MPFLGPDQLFQSFQWALVVRTEKELAEALVHDFLSTPTKYMLGSLVPVTHALLHVGEANGVMRPVQEHGLFPDFLLIPPPLRPYLGLLDCPAHRSRQA